MTPSISAQFTHQDHIVRGKRLPLRVHKIDGERIVAVCDDDQPDENGVWPRLFYFPKGLAEKDVTWLDSGEPATEASGPLREDDECLEEWL